jgi:hypothetical protein
MAAELSIGNVRKKLLIIGDRTCTYRPLRDPCFSEPEPFVEMDIRYERAYGGVDIRSNPFMQYPYPRNHIGKGFAVKNKRHVIDGLTLPNIEDPEDIIHPGNICCVDMKNWQSQPLPQGFGWVSKQWYPRIRLAGVMPADRALEQELRKLYLSAVPESQRQQYEKLKLPSMDFGFFNGASPGLTVPFIQGNEALRFINLSQDYSLTCRLPGEQPVIHADIGLGAAHLKLFIQTVMIRMEDRQIDLIWRAGFPYPGPDWLPEMKKLDIQII